MRTSSGKPLLRGVVHQWAAVFTLGAGTVLVALSPAGTPRFSAAVFAASLLVLFTVSAVYHRPTWSPPRRAFMRRLDHAAIFVLIAGTYTPVCLLALEPASAQRMLALVWAGALAGVLQAVIWVKPPRWLASAIYVGLGWVLISDIGAVHAALGTGRLALLFVGGLLYTVGALAYAFKWPDPAPAVFGYHEVFHACTVVAAAAHGAVVITLVR